MGEAHSDSQLRGGDPRSKRKSTEEALPTRKRCWGDTGSHRGGPAGETSAPTDEEALLGRHRLPQAPTEEALLGRHRLPQAPTEEALLGRDRLPQPQAPNEEAQTEAVLTQISKVSTGD